MSYHHCQMHSLSGFQSAPWSLVLRELRPGLDFSNGRFIPQAFQRTGPFVTFGDTLRIESKGRTEKRKSTGTYRYRMIASFSN
jgi:hypothetical protein